MVRVGISIVQFPHGTISRWIGGDSGHMVYMVQYLPLRPMPYGHVHDSISYYTVQLDEPYVRGWDTKDSMVPRSDVPDKSSHSPKL